MHTQYNEVAGNAAEGYHNTEILQMSDLHNTSGHPKVGGSEQCWSTSVVCFVEGPCSAEMTLEMRS
jgi:hypothetical protein